MAILKIIGVVEALNERIKIQEEEIAILERRVKALKDRTSVVGTLYTLCVLIGLAPSGWGAVNRWGLGQYVTRQPLSEQLLVLMVLGIVFVVIASYFAYKKHYRVKKQIKELRQKLLDRYREVARLTQQKRDLLLSKELEIKQETEMESHELKECPMCAEMVKAKALICRYCRHKFVSL